MLVLAHLRCGDTYSRLAAGFGVGLATVCRYIHEAVQLLAAPAPDLADALKTAMRKAYATLDGTLVPIDRIAADRPYYSGTQTPRHERPSPRRPRRATALDLIRTARLGPRPDRGPRHGIVDALAGAEIPCWADMAYRGTGGPVRVPYRGKWHNLSPGQQAVNRSHARIRALGERAVSILKAWRLLRRLRCSTTRITDLTRAVLTLHLNAG